ncbi:MAG: hypothetical protein K2N41_07465 [Lachnospiraceae bacterium]|nr:hypothetical protein [Lachnospiraceae bacterium]MDE7239535.1 hypothetical protein [Lachnospiraceae bacterium]
MDYYWLPVIGRSDYIYSCDMLRYKFEVKSGKYAKGDLQKLLTAYGRLDIKHYPTNFSDFKYRDLFTIDYDTSTMTVGIGFNGCKNDDLVLGFLEVNPNKCFDSLQCLYDIQRIFDACWSFDLLRFDLAIDLPFSRDNVSLVKDGRKYRLDLHSKENKTEYLGVRNASGYVKLYNKSLEQKNDNEILTRLEMTCAGDWSVDQIIFKLPYVFTSGSDFTEADKKLKHLSSSQKVIVRALRSHPDRDELFKSLCADMRVKLRPYIYDAETVISYDSNAILAVLENIRQFEQSMKSHVYTFVSQADLREDAARRFAIKRGKDFVDVPDSENPFREN